MVFTCLQYKSFENTVGKGEIACNEQFLLFPPCLLPILRIVCLFHKIYNCRVQTRSVLQSLEFVIWERVKALCIQSLHTMTWPSHIAQSVACRTLEQAAGSIPGSASISSEGW